jgi:hypothetical protein
MHAIEAMPAFTPPSPVEGEGILWSPPHKIGAEQGWGDRWGVTKSEGRHCMANRYRT